MLGQFLEVSVSTADIRASVEFYESLGFSQCSTADIWSHPYGVLTDGRLHIGLHQYRFASPALTFVLPDIARHAANITDLGIELAFSRTGDASFNEIGFYDPFGQMITILEARTFSRSARSAPQTSHCGWFAEFSIPSSDFARSTTFWQRLGFIALEEDGGNATAAVLVRDGLSLALHRSRTEDRPMLVFRDATMRERLTQLRSREFVFSDALPRGLDSAANGMLESPEGLPLLLLEETS